MLKLSPEQLSRFLSNEFIDSTLFEIIKAKEFVIERRGIKACFSSHEELVNSLLSLIETVGAECTPFTPLICTDGERNTLFLDVEDNCLLFILNPLYQLKLAEKYDKALERLEKEPQEVAY